MFLDLCNFKMLLDATSVTESTIDEVTEQAAQTLQTISGEEVDASALHEYLDALPSKLIGWLFNVAFAIIFIIIFWKVINTITKLIRKSMEKAGVDESMIHFLCMLVSVGLKILLLFIVAAQLGFNTASIVALLGSAGVAIGLAVQGTLSNLAGGVMILLTKPFRLGDYIIEDTKNHEGTVKEISLFTTKLVTPDNRIIILPNGDLANTSLTNSTSNKIRLLEINVGISYDSDLRQAKSVLKQTIDKCGYVLKDHDNKVVVNSLEDSCVELSMRCYVKAYDFLAAKWELTENAKLSLDDAGIEIPFNQLDVHMK